MKRGVRTLVGTAIGLAVAQLVLSTSQDGGHGGTLLAAGFQYPAQWLRDFMDPSKPGIPQVASKGSASTASATTGGTTAGLPPTVAAGLSGTGTPAGTGSTTIKSV